MARASRFFRHARPFRLEHLEDRTVPATVPILMADASTAYSVAHWGNVPTTVGTVKTCSIFDSQAIITTNIAGKKIDFNKDGYADVLEIGRADNLIGYSDSNTDEPLSAASRNGYGIVGLGGPNGLTYDTKPTKAGSYLKNQFVGTDVVAADLNRDGYDDILYRGSALPQSTVSSRGMNVYSRYWNPGQKQFGPETFICTMDAWVGKVNSWRFGDVNGDSMPDMVTPNFDPTAVNDMHAYVGMQVFLGKPDANGLWSGAFQSTPWATVAAQTPSSAWGIPHLRAGSASTNPSITPVLADLTGDGKLDLAIPETDGITVYTNPGDGKFVPASSVHVAVPAGSLGGQQLFAGDFNKDGKLDLVTSPNLAYLDLWVDTGASSRVWTASTSPITLFLNTSAGSPSFTAQSVNAYDSQSLPNGQIALADFDLDGNLDIAVASGLNSSFNYGILQNNGDGTFNWNANNIGYSNEADGYVNTFRRGPVGLGAADINNDGLPDIATAASNFGQSNRNSGLNNDAVGITGVSFNRSFTNPAVGNPTLPAATQGQPYTARLIGSGGDPSLPYVFSLNKSSLALPIGLALAPDGTISGTPTQSGPFRLAIDVTQTNGLRGTTAVVLQVNPGHVIISPPIIVTAPEQGGQPIHVLTPDGTLRASITPFFGFGGAVRVATGDVTNDGIVDILAISGRGITTMVRVFDGVTHAMVREFAPYGPSVFTGGYVAVGDVLDTHPGNEIVVSPMSGRLRIRVFDANGQYLTSFTPFTAKYAGPVPISVANIDGQAGEEIIAAIPFKPYRSQIRWFNGNGSLLGTFTALGNQLSVGDVDGDGKAEVVTVCGVGCRPIVRIYDPNYGGVLDNEFYGYNPAYRGQLHVALVRRADGSRYDVVTALAAKTPTNVYLHDAVTGAFLNSFLAYSDVFSFGLNIAGG